MSRSTPLLLICALVIWSGCRASTQLRVGRGIDHDFVDEGDAGEVGEDPESGPAVGTASPNEPPPSVPANGNRAEVETDEQPAKQAEAEADDEENTIAVAPRAVMLRGRRLTSEGDHGPGSWSADGGRVLFQATRSGGFVDDPRPQTWLMDADGGNQRRITMGIGTTERGVFIPGRTQEVSYASNHHAETTPGANESTPEVDSRDDLELYVQDLTKGSFVALTDSPGYDGDASWCGDGSRLAFVSERDGNAEIYTMAADGTDLRRVTERAGTDRAPSLSPDCSRLAWIAEGERGDALMVAAADGSKAAALLEASAKHDDPAWMPHGQVLLFSSTMASDDETHDLFALALQGGAIKRLTASTGNERSPAPSPDGARILYTADRTGRAQLFVAELEPGVGEEWTLR